MYFKFKQLVKRDARMRLSDKPDFQTLTENRQWWCWCHLFRQGVPDTGTSNCEDPAADCWELGGWYQQATRAGRVQCSSTGLICYPSEWSRYRGADPCRTLYVSRAILYSIRSGTRSQRRLTRASVMWSVDLMWQQHGWSTTWDPQTTFCIQDRLTRL